MHPAFCKQVGDANVARSYVASRYRRNLAGNVLRLADGDSYHCSGGDRNRSNESNATAWTVLADHNRHATGAIATATILVNARNPQIITQKGNHMALNVLARDLKIEVIVFDRPYHSGQLENQVELIENWCKAHPNAFILDVRFEPDVTTTKPKMVIFYR
jgi:hypothetical protein